MIKKNTPTRQVSPAPTSIVLGSADLARATGGAEASTSVMKTRHETAKNAIGNVR